jgi:hypothetical protein
MYFMFQPPRDPRTPKEPHNEQPKQHPALDDLREIPGNVFDTFFGNEDDSRQAIAEAVRGALDSQGLSVYVLHEQSGLSCEVIDGVLDGHIDLRDSEVLTTLQFALKVPLTHL